MEVIQVQNRVFFWKNNCNSLNINGEFEIR